MKLRFVLAACLIAVFLALVASSCHKTPAVESVDLAKGIEPVSREFASLDSANRELAAMKPEARPAWIASHLPDLPAKVMKYVREHQFRGVLADPKSVEIMFGSVGGVKAEDASHKLHQGFVKEQLVARIWSSDETQSPVVMILLCANGMVATEAKMLELQQLTTYVPPEALDIVIVVIEPGESLGTYMDLEEALLVAENDGLAIYRGPVTLPEFRITVEQAWEMVDKGDFSQITVVVFPGDKLDISDERLLPVYIPATPKPTRK